jgi:malate dehydrogenase
MLPCAAYLGGEYGISGVYAGVPVVLGMRGAERIVQIELEEGEMSLLLKSAEHVRSLMDKLG